MGRYWDRASICTRWGTEALKESEIAITTCLPPELRYMIKIECEFRHIRLIMQTQLVLRYHPLPSSRNRQF